MTSAEHLIELVGDKTAWNFPKGEHWPLRRTSINQHGTRYDFADGSSVWIPAGTARPQLAPHQ